MEDTDVVDDVNALLNLGVGDAYRLEHIKQAYIQNKTIWITDKNYLQRMRDKYLIKHSDIQTDSEENTEDKSEEEKIHCWKCGKKSTLGANFCMVCGASLFEVAADSKVEREPIPFNLKNKTNLTGLKIPIMIGIPVLILAIIGGAYSQGIFDSAFERYDSKEPEKIDTKTNTVDSAEKTVVTETNSKCGTGTIFDPETNSCVLASKKSSTEREDPTTETNSKCGTGTVFDPETNSCVLDK